MDVVAKLRQRSTPKPLMRHKYGLKTTLNGEKKGDGQRVFLKKMPLSFKLLQNDGNSTEIQPNALYLIV